MDTFKLILEELAKTHVPLLLVGEPGVGKRMVARQIYEASARRTKAFVECDCRKADEETIKAQFNPDANGNGGATLYLAYVHALSLAGQRALLRCVEASEHDVNRPRIIASATSDIDLEVRNGRFREDLYYSLSRICVPVAPLRYRKDDIGALAEQYLSKYADQFGRPKPALTPALLRFLHSHPWTRNVCELKDAMRTVVAIGNDRIAIAALQASSLGGSREKRIGMEVISLKEVARAASERAERELIVRVLSRTHWNRKQAAEELRISYKALLYKLKKISATPGVAQGGKSQ